MTTPARPAVALVVCLLVGLGAPPPARGDDAGVEVDAAVPRALAYLGREVPAWSRDHHCFSCHNNGDAARALYEAIRLGRGIEPPATADTDAWLGAPARWDHNGGDGPFSDKVLARVAFTAGLAAAVSAQRVPRGRAALVEASRILIRDQTDDGAWRVDASDPVGSPATYGRPLATWLAVGVLRQADPVEFAPAIERAQAWLGRVEPTNAPSAAVVLLAARRAGGTVPADRVEAALRWFQQGQATDGGWGPFTTAPPEVFDTALGVLALASHRDRPGVRALLDRGRAFLVANQNPDGSWTETTRPSGGESYAQRLSTTGWATLALLTPTPPGAAQNLLPAAVDDTRAPAANLPSHPSEHEILMADPRNIAHDKKVQDEKKHHHEPVAPENAAVAPQPGKKTPTIHDKPTEEPTSTHATSQHHKDKTTGHVEEPPEVQAEANAKENATDK